MDRIRFEDNMCLVKVGKRWIERTNFFMRMLYQVVGERDSGYVVEVIRASDGVSGLAHFRMKDLSTHFHLQHALNSSFPESGLLCYLKPEEIFMLMKKLDEELRQRETVTRKELLTIAGYQDELNVCFLNPQQVVCLASGKLIDPESLPVTWISDWPGNHCPREELFHRIPEPVSIGPFKVFLQEAKVHLKNNFPQALLCWMSMLMMFRYKWVLNNLRHFNLTMLFGEPSVGKTLIASCGAWLVGCQETQIASRCTLPFLIQWITSSSMPFVWDDPSSPEEVGQLAVDLGNGAVRGKATESVQVPQTGCLVTANFDLSSVVRHYSRLFVLEIKQLVGRKEPGVAIYLEEKARDASNSLPILLKWIADITAEDINDTTREMQAISSADLRVIEGIAVPLTATRKILREIDQYDLLDDVINYVRNVHLNSLAVEVTSQEKVVERIAEKCLSTPLRRALKDNCEEKEDEFRLVKTFVVESLGIADKTLKLIGKEASKVVRMQGKLLRAVILKKSSLPVELCSRMRDALNDIVMEDQVSATRPMTPDVATTTAQSRPTTPDVATTTAQSRPMTPDVATTTAQSRPMTPDVATTTAQSRPTTPDVVITEQRRKRSRQDESPVLRRLRSRGILIKRSLSGRKLKR